MALHTTTLLLHHSTPLPSRHLPNLFFPLSLPPPPKTLKFRSTTFFPALFPPHRILRPAAVSLSDQHLLDALSNGEARSHLPAVRSFENDLCRLTLVGAVGVNQAITAAAADGGDAADEHLASRAATMVVETVFPGRAGEHSTVSTRLFLPTEKVKEKAKRLRTRLGDDLSSAFSTRNILARTFRQVVLQNLWSFELSLYPPESRRNMKDLANPREMQGQFTISSSDEGILVALAEVLCACALDTVEGEYIRAMGAKSSRDKFGFFQKQLWTVSADSSVSICRLSKSEIIKISKENVKFFKFSKDKSTDRKREVHHKWWPPPTYCGMDKIGGPGFTDWSIEHIPTYRIQVDASKLKDAEVHGWQLLGSADNRLEALLTHFQLVELANVLDMLFEDRYTIPEKDLKCHWKSRSSHVSKSKISFWKTVSLALACGCVLVSFGILAQVHSPQLFKNRKASEKHTLISSNDRPAEMESLCISIIKKIKNAYDRPEDIMVDRSIGVWMGQLPVTLKTEQTDGSASAGLLVGQNMGNEMTPAPAQDVGSYQVVLQNGEIIGFQPMNDVSVLNSEANSLANILHNGSKLFPGLFDHGLKNPWPSKNILIQLLISDKPESWFVLARPLE